MRLERFAASSGAVPVPVLWLLLCIVAGLVLGVASFFATQAFLSLLVVMALVLVGLFCLPFLPPILRRLRRCAAHLEDSASKPAEDPSHDHDKPAPPPR